MSITPPPIWKQPGTPHRSSTRPGWLQLEYCSFTHLAAWPVTSIPRFMLFVQLFLKKQHFIEENKEWIVFWMNCAKNAFTAAFLSHGDKGGFSGLHIQKTIRQTVEVDLLQPA